MTDIRDWEGSVGPGWWPIVVDLYNDIEKISPNHRIVQIKEKFGGLRYYYESANNDAVNDLVQEAERKCYITCEKCGEPGKLRNYNRLYPTLCDKHVDEKQAKGFSWSNANLGSYDEDITEDEIKSVVKKVRKRRAIMRETEHLESLEYQEDE